MHRLAARNFLTRPLLAVLRPMSVAAPPAAVVLPPTPDGIAAAGGLIAGGRCVAFPTETVYGLGANALDPGAVREIFTHKGRPLTDPLIVHVLSVEEALGLVCLGREGEVVFRRLADAFWPGPLTLVARADAVIPPLVTAGTGFVGVRSPLHPIARSLIAAVSVCGLCVIVCAGV